MLREVDGTLRQASPIPVLGLSVVMVAAIALLDHLTGFEISFSIFYLIPISVSAWYLGRTAGLTLSVLSAAAWLAVDLTAGHHYSNHLIPAWNGSVRLGFYVLVTSLLVLSKRNLIQVARLARIDSLTGVLNSGAFREVVTERIQLAARSGQAVVLAYIDIDDFKAINDTWGHAEGDRVLQAVAETLSRHVRKTDVVGRVGGDEFAMLFPGTDQEGAREVLDKIRAQLTRITSDAGWPIGFSIGAAVFIVPPKDPEEAINKADALMYRGKQSGKNMTVFLDSDSMSGAPPHDGREER